MKHRSNHRLSWRSLLAVLGVLALALLVQNTVSHAEPPSPNAPQGASTLGDFVWHDFNADGIKDGSEWGQYGIDGVVINLYLDDGDYTFDPDSQGGGDAFQGTMTTGDDPNASGTQHGWYDFVVTANGNNYWVEIDDSNFASGGALEHYAYTGNLGPYDYNGPEPRLVLMPNAIMDYNDADFGYALTGIQLVKTAGNAADGETEYIYSGDDVVYHYTVTNTGETHLSDITIVDDNGTPGDTSDDINVCTIAGPLAPNASASCDFTVQNVTADVTNIATATGNPTDSNGNDLPANDVSDSDDAVVDVVAPAIQLVKTADSAADGDIDYINSGDDVVYHYTVTNTGDTYLSNIVITDDNGTPNDTTDDFTVCTIAGPLAPNASASCDFTVQNVTTDVTNMAEAKANPTDSNGNDLPDLADVCDDDDAVVVLYASLGDFVWHDVNANGVQDSGEPGIDGVTVDLFKSDGTFVATTQTANGGQYLFDNLVPGDYYVQFTLPSGYVFSPKDQGGDNAKDSDADAATGKTDVTTLTSGENDLTWDAGMYQKASLGDFVWHDLNANGVQDSGEPGIDGVTVDLFKSDGTFVATTQTANGGQYLFDNLVPGDYYVQFTLPSGYVFSPKDQGGDDAKDSDADAATGKTDVTTLTSGENDLTWDAGMYQKASIGDFVWWDLNEDGIQDAGEPGLAGVTVTLKDSNGATVATATTDANGAYSFPNLDPGDYYLIFTLPGADWSFSPKDQGGDDAKDSDADTTTGQTATTTLTSGENDLTWDAGMTIPSSYTITKENTTVETDLTPGDPISFTITITNTGKTWLAVVPLKDEYDTDYLTYVDANPASDDNLDDGVINWSDLTVSFGHDLAPGDSFTVIVNFTAKAATDPEPNHETINTATAHNVLADPDGPTGPNGATGPLADQSDDAPVRILNPVGEPMDGFSATVTGGQVQVHWRSLSEANILGYNVLRRTKTGQFEQVNADLIFARYAGSDQGATYSFTDVPIGLGQYVYALEIVRLDGGVERYGLASITISLPSLRPDFGANR